MTFELHILVFILLLNVDLIIAIWDITTHQSTLLSHKNYVKSAAYVNGTIYIFGNEDDCSSSNTQPIFSDTQCIKYHVPNHQMQISYRLNTLQMCSKQYAQINHALYWFDTKYIGPNLLQQGFIYEYNVYDVSLINDMIHPILYTFYPCLTSFKHSLYILGGETVPINGNDPNYVSPIVLVLDIITNELLTNVASMNIARKTYACTVDTLRGNIYAIAGIENGGTHSIEILSVNNTVNAQWTLHKNISFGGLGHRAQYIEYSDTIIVIGGEDKFIRIIDCKTGNISQAMVQLPYDMFAPVTVIVHNVLYVFEGTNTWITIENDDIFGNYSVISTLATTTLSASTETIIMTNGSVDRIDYEANAERTKVLRLIIVLLLLVVLLLCAIVAAFCCCKQDKKYVVPYNENKVHVDNVQVVEMEVYEEEDDESQKNVQKVQQSDSESKDTKAKVSFIVDGESDSDDDVITRGRPKSEDSVSRKLDRVVTNAMSEGCNEEMNTDHDEVKVWLDSLELSMHYDTFVKNGFDSIEMIKEVNDKTDLEEIGITLAAHRLKLMNHIEKLKEETEYC